MQKIQLFLVLGLSIFTFSCKKTNSSWNEPSELVNLSELNETAFVPTLENPIDANKNYIYAPAFLFAWDKIEEALVSPIIIDKSNSNELNLVANSTSHLKSLTESEYTAEFEINDGIVAKAFFNKTLPFETKLQVLETPILFNNKEKVSAFGMCYYDQLIVQNAEILYYKDDSNFIIKLSPKDKLHEIIIVKGISKYKTLSEALTLTNNLIAQGEKNKKESKQAWKYEITAIDYLAIPSISFNIETNYNNLVGQTFKTKDGKKHGIEVAYQRTALILNENGAVVESEAEISVDSAGIEEPIKIEPKKLIFDKSFVLILKRVHSSNPYFVMQVANSELLTKK